jgi:hypothetical protein
MVLRGINAAGLLETVSDGKSIRLVKCHWAQFDAWLTLFGA